MLKNTVKPADIAVIGIILFAALLSFLGFYFPKGDAGELVCAVTLTSTDGTSIKRYPVSQNAEYELSNNGHVLTLVIENGEVWVKSADCPDKTCELTGKISSSGAVIACVPAKIMITIENGEKSDVDFTAG